MTKAVDIDRQIHRLKQKLVTGTKNSNQVKEAINKLEAKRSSLYNDEWLAR